MTKCHKCNKVFEGAPVTYGWIPPNWKGGIEGVTLKFCSSKCKTAWLTGDGAGPESLTKKMRLR